MFKSKAYNYPTMWRRSYKYKNILEHFNDPQNIKWLNVLTSLELHEAVRIFTSFLNYIHDQPAPLKVYQKRKKYIPLTTEELKILMSESEFWKDFGKNKKISG